jgi:hypothetical protein
VRALCINDRDAWEILDQYNAPTTDADIAGVCAIPDLQGGRPTLTMYDRRTRSVHFFKPAEGGTYEIDRSIQVGSLDLKAMRTIPMKKRQRGAVMLADSSRIVLIQPDRAALKATELTAYESSVDDARLSRLSVGDLNHDGIRDLAVIDVQKHFVELLTLSPTDDLLRATKFRVFAEKRYGMDDRQIGEPRWIEVADVTNDGWDDLILIAHDRILLYPGQ